MTDQDIKIYLEEEIQAMNIADSKLNEVYKDIKVYSSSDLNVDLMGTLLIDLPKDIYYKSIMSLDVIDEIAKIQKKMKIIEDNESREVSKREELKNQTQRDAELRMSLLGNKIYNTLETTLSKYDRIKKLLLFQTEYFNKLLDGVKIRYRQACAIILNDKNLNDVVRNGWWH